MAPEIQAITVYHIVCLLMILSFCMTSTPLQGRKLRFPGRHCDIKILHWRPEFHSWSPHFPIWRLKKKDQSPVGACLKKLISDPDTEFVNKAINWTGVVRLFIYLYVSIATQ